MENLIKSLFMSGKHDKSSSSLFLLRVHLFWEIIFSFFHLIVTLLLHPLVLFFLFNLRWALLTKLDELVNLKENEFVWFYFNVNYKKIPFFQVTTKK